jgi:hypothetical protein
MPCLGKQQKRCGQRNEVSLSGCQLAARGCAAGAEPVSIGGRSGPSWLTGGEEGCSPLIPRPHLQIAASKSPAAPMPPPTHIVTMPQRFLRRRSSSSRVPVMREPVMP